jgi:hypothetical protein
MTGMPEVGFWRGKAEETGDLHRWEANTLGVVCGQHSADVIEGCANVWQDGC